VATSSTPAGDEDPLKLTAGEKVAKVQIALHDGKKLVAEVNPLHTVGQLRAFVAR